MCVATCSHQLMSFWMAWVTFLLPKLGGHPSPMEEWSSMWVGVLGAVWSVTLLLVMMPALLALVHQPVLMSQPHQGRSPHNWRMGGRPGSSSFSSWICWRWVLIQNPKNCMSHPNQLVFFCPAIAGQWAPFGSWWAWLQALQFSS